MVVFHNHPVNSYIQKIEINQVLSIDLGELHREKNYFMLTPMLIPTIKLTAVESLQVVEVIFQIAHIITNSNNSNLRINEVYLTIV